MEVPGAVEVGWYRYGPAPGSSGSAVLAAHVDYEGREGAFFRLRELRPGAEVEVTAKAGASRRFRVTEVVRYPKDELPDDRVFGRDGGPRLALVTCGGEFDRSARTYRDNVVAFAEPVV
jgi:sortase (surface protein transpeptidase)